MRLSPKSITGFHEFIFSWWDEHRRDLPWRRTHDPYKILVSEIMLQQTQVVRVLPKYEKFLSEFPDVSSLARASTAAVLRAWKGMGYNRRALYLQKTAQAVVGQYGGVFPDSEKSLTQLPGLGKYTARAVLVFAFRQNVAMVDTNIRKIITRYFFGGIARKESDIQDIADRLVPPGKSWEWHQALMDYGALELPKLTKKSSGKRQTPRIPFHKTKRYFRGRIMDLLRTDQYQENRLIRYVSKIYAKKTEEIKDIIEDLIKDGLVVRTGRIIHLPE